MSISTYQNLKYYSEVGMWTGVTMVAVPPIVTFVVKHARSFVQEFLVRTIMNSFVSGPWTVTVVTPKPYNIDFLWACSKKCMAIGAVIAVVSWISFHALDAKIQHLKSQRQYSRNPQSSES